MDLAELRHAVTGAGAGMRSRAELLPLGGPGDKVFPPTYLVEGRAETAYAVETRRIDGVDVPCAILDSVASQANRREVALLEATRRKEIELPLVSVDFRPTVVDLDRISSLEAPHRIFDALLRDSLVDGVLFRMSDVGRAVTEATHRNAAALLRWSPTTLLFGGWDSTGPKGGRGAKYERAIAAEITAIGIRTGVRTSSRIDPAGIVNGVTVYEAADDEWGWAIDEAHAKVDAKGQPAKVTGGAGVAGRPSQVNHSNIPPTRDERAGGITADRIDMVTTLSFAGIRRLRFPADAAGRLFSDGERAEAEAAAHCAVAALGIAASVLAAEDGFDLRSRCVLVPAGPLSFDLVHRDGTAEAHIVSRAEALDLLGAAIAAVREAGLSWETNELLLTPADRLVELIRRSHELAKESIDSGDDQVAD